MALLRVLLILPLALVTAARAGGEENSVEADARSARRTIAVGDTFRLDIDLKWPEGVSVKPLALGESLGEFAVRDIAYSPITADDGLSARRISLLLTVFETGTLTVPPVPFLFMDRDGNAGRAETPKVEIEVQSVLPDDAEDIRDIKAPVEVPKRWKDIITGWSLLIGLVAAAAGSVLVSMKRREELEDTLRRIWIRLAGPVARLVRWLLARLWRVGRDDYGAPALDSGIAEPYLTPEQAALREFDRIDAMHLPRQGKTLELNTLVSETVRRYLERRFRILAMESPTSHTIADLRGREVSLGVLGLTQEVLEETDLVKFARFRPAEDRAFTLTDRGRRLVRNAGDDKTGKAESEAVAS